jgi:undecaprenyl-diphosphatase
MLFNMLAAYTQASVMNSFDLGIIDFLNRFAGRWPAFDSVLVLMSHNLLLQGAFVLVFFWWAWAQQDEKTTQRRELLIFGLFASIFAVLLARTLAVILPFRLRPLHNPALHFRLPYSMSPETLLGWSSFPSDHAVVVFCLATVVWLASKRLGAAAFAFGVLFSSFPRVYLGIHYPTDILAGAVLGIGAALLGKWDPVRESVLRPAAYWREHSPGSFAALLFFCSFELGESFNSILGIAHFGVAELGHRGLQLASHMLR